MANRAPYKVTTEISELTGGLVNGQAYRAQHVGGSIVLYCDYPTQPTLETNIAWFQFGPRENIRFEGSTTEPTWVRTLTGEATLAIGEI